MANESKEALKESIKAEDIVFDNRAEEVDDADMPRPQTKLYKTYLKLSDKFMALFYGVVNGLPYRAELNYNGHTIKLVKLVRFVEQNRSKLTIGQVNEIIGFISDVSFQYARPFMEAVEDKGRHSELWTVFEE